MTAFEGRAWIRRRADERDRLRVGQDLRRACCATPQGYPQAMSDRLRVACVQLNAGTVKADNLETAERLVARGGRDRRRPRRPAGEVERDRLRRHAARERRAARGRRVRSTRWRAGRAGTGSRSSAARSPRSATAARSSRTRAPSSTRPASSSPSTERSTCSTSRWAATSTASRRPRSPARRPSSARPRAGGSG